MEKYPLMPLDWRLFFLGLWVSLFRGPSEAGVAAAIGFAMFNIGIPSGLIGILGMVKKSTSPTHFICRIMNWLELNLLSLPKDIKIFFVSKAPYRNLPRFYKKFFNSSDLLINFFYFWIPFSYFSVLYFRFSYLIILLWIEI